jgi:four helix bundle protein
MLKSYRDLEVWQKAIDLVVMCYQITKKFPHSEIYGLGSQLQRAAVSIPVRLILLKEGNDSIVKNLSNTCILLTALLLN